MRTILLAALLAMPPLADAADPMNCSVKAKKLDEATRKLAVIDYDQAKAAALAAAPGERKELRGGGLEVDRGCLVYRYDVEVAGQKGVQEVFVDAANGAILAQVAESRAKHAIEAAIEMATGKTH